MDTVNNGGPAFPSICESVNGVPMAKGLTVRDYFAAKAMQAEISRQSYGIEDAARDVADAAYEYADAMLAAREVPGPDYDWIKWAGGDCPVASDQWVEVKCHDGSAAVDQAGEFHWAWLFGGKEGDIVAYRIVTP